MIIHDNIDKTELIEALPELWGPLSEEQRAFLLDNIEIRIFKKNEPIYKENEKPKHLMCLMKGKVKIHIEGICNHSQIVRIIGDKGLFGYRAAFAGEDYLTGASAFEDSMICLIPIDIIKKLISENNSLANYFIKQLARMLGEADINTVNLSQKHIRGRLADALLLLKEKYGTEDDSVTLNISPSREDIATMSNMTTSNAIRTLSAFASECLIATEGKKIKIIDEQELLNISKQG